MEEPVERNIKERIYLFVGEHKVLAVITVSIITVGLGAVAVFRLRVHMAHYPKDADGTRKILEEWAETEGDFEVAKTGSGTIGSSDIFHGWFFEVELRSKKAFSSVYQAAERIIKGLKLTLNASSFRSGSEEDGKSD